MIDSHWALSIWPKIHFNAPYKGRFSIKSLIPFHIFRHWIAVMKKKISIPLDQVIKKVVTPSNRSGSKRAEPQNSQSIPPKSSSSLPTKSFFISIHCIPLWSPRTSWKPSPMLLIWRWICFYPPRPENTEENQPITNLKRRTFANTTVTNRNVKDFAIRWALCSNLYDVSGMI